MKKIFTILILSSLFAGELEVDGDLKVTGSVVFQDETSINTASSLPPGVIMPYLGEVAPSGWLLCHGQEVSRTEYSDLFSLLLITYGVGDQINTFNLPDLRGRMLLGADNMGGVNAEIVTDEQADVLGGKGGDEMTTLTIEQIPPHTHQQSSSDTDVQCSSNCGPRLSGIGGVIDQGEEASPHNNMPPFMTVNYIIKY